MGMPVAELDEMAKSAISELTNMILGNTATIFYNNGVAVDITPPSLLMGSNIQISTSKMQTICIPLALSNDTTFEIDVAIQENR
jgi:chemotaxis protein CheX